MPCLCSNSCCAAGHLQLSFKTIPASDNDGFASSTSELSAGGSLHLCSKDVWIGGRRRIGDVVIPRSRTIMATAHSIAARMLTRDLFSNGETAMT